MELEKDGEDTLRWNDNVRNEDMLHRAKEERSILETMKKRLTRLVTYNDGTWRIKTNEELEILIKKKRIL